MAKENKDNDEKAVNSLKSIGLFTIGIASSLYLTLLYKITWNWFLADKLFEVGYWELFLGLVIFRYMILDGSTTALNSRMNEKFGRRSYSVRVGNLIGRTTVNTTIFGILYVIHLMISYYS